MDVRSSSKCPRPARATACGSEGTWSVRGCAQDGRARGEANAYLSPGAHLSHTGTSAAQSAQNVYIRIPGRGRTAMPSFAAGRREGFMISYVRAELTSVHLGAWPSVHEVGLSSRLDTPDTMADREGVR